MALSKRLQAELEVEVEGLILTSQLPPNIMAQIPPNPPMAELRQSALLQGFALDALRTKKMQRVVQLTGNALVTYAVDWTSQNVIKAQAAGNLMSLTWNDKESFDQVTRELTGEYEGLDVILHSPGGQIEPVEGIVEMLRTRFPRVRFIIPNAAKSAATMLAMAGDELLMDEVSELGPTDPQITIPRSNGLFTQAAQSILDDFTKAQEAVNSNPAQAPLWVTVLDDYALGLFSQCQSATQLSQHLVSKWLKNYMFSKDEGDVEAKANTVAEHLSTHGNFFSHTRRIGIDKLQELGVKVHDLRKESEKELRDAIRDVYDVTAITLLGNNVGKLFENHLGIRTFVPLVINQEGATQAQPEQSSNSPSNPVAPSQPRQGALEPKPQPLIPPKPSNPRNDRLSRSERKNPGQQGKRSK